MKTEALKLADLLAISGKESIEREASAMIRRLVEELDKQKETIRNLNKTLGFVNSGYEVISLEPQTKPLSDGEIDESFDRTASHMANEYVSHYEPTAWINHIKQTGGDFYELNVSGRGEPLYRHPPQTKSLSADEIKEAFNQWLMLDEGVARFDYQLKHTWVAEQWERWQKAFKSAEVLK